MIEVLNYEFMQRALIGGLLISIASSLIGVFLVLKKMSLLGDSFAHASFGGIAIGLLTGINPIITAMGFISVIALGLERLISRAKLYGDSAIALILSFGMAFALILVSFADKLNTTIFSYLFGSILTISYEEILYILVIVILIIVFFIFFYRSLFYSAFNKEIARVRDKNSNLVDKIFVVLAALTVVVSIKSVGLLLISAILVIPALIGLNLANSFKQTIIYSLLGSIIGIYSGIWGSYMLDSPAGPTIVISLLIVYLFSLLIKIVIKKESL